MSFDRRALLGVFAGTLVASTLCLPFIGGSRSPLSEGARSFSDEAWAASSDTANQVVMTTKDGKIVIQLRPDLAPNHVKQIETLTRQKFYDGIVFHRVIPGFMAQTGDPTGTGAGGSQLPDLKAEFSSEPFTRGTVGMARSQSPDSANSQFFICFDDASFLNSKYTVVGQVVSGMDVVDKIKKGSAEDNGSVTNPDKIVTMKMVKGQ